MSVPPNFADPPAATRPPVGGAGVVRYAEQSRPRGSTSAFWGMVRRVTVMAACVDVALLVFFLAVGSPLLGWLNLVSIAMYAGANVLLSRRRNLPALLLIWTEVIAHAAIGTVLVGWDSGFHYYLLMFIPAIMVSGSARKAIGPLTFLFVAYLGLHGAAQFYGPQAPLSAGPLAALNVFNVSIFFGMAGYTARFYYSLVRQSERKLRELATRDTLTGLFNRRHLLELAAPEIARARRTGEALSLVIADIDHFKRVNDSHGHDAGDQVLVHAGQVFREVCRPQDIFARWGGEEFLFLLPATGAQAASAFAERLRQAIAAARVGLSGATIQFSISLGVTTMLDSDGLLDAITRADDALYRSKTEGRDRVSVAIPPSSPSEPLGCSAP